MSAGPDKADIRIYRDGTIGVMMGDNRAVMAACAAYEIECRAALAKRIAESPPLSEERLREIARWMGTDEFEDTNDSNEPINP